MHHNQSETNQKPISKSTSRSIRNQSETNHKSIRNLSEIYQKPTENKLGIYQKQRKPKKLKKGTSIDNGLIAPFYN